MYSDYTAGVLQATFIFCCNCTAVDKSRYSAIFKVVCTFCYRVNCTFLPLSLSLSGLKNEKPVSASYRHPAGSNGFTLTSRRVECTDGAAPCVVSYPYTPFPATSPQTGSLRSKPLLTVLAWCGALLFFENTIEIAVLVTNCRSNVVDTHRCFTQQLFGRFHANLSDIINKIAP